LVPYIIFGAHASSDRFTGCFIITHFGSLKQTAVFPNGKLNNIIEGNIEGRIEVTGRRGKRPKQLQIDVKERRGYCKLKKEALDRTVWRTRF